MRDAERESGSDHAAETIWNDLVGLRNAPESERQAPVYHWTNADQPPEVVGRGGILIGEQPRLGQLRQGFFASRPSLLATLTEGAEAWLERQADAPDDLLRVPVLWLGGRSGAGKSVALIQLLARLHAATGALILWLGNRVGLLPAATQIASSIGNCGDRAIVAVDDPYRPDSQDGISPEWPELLAVVETARQSGDSEAVPLLICCGPTEQADRLQADFPDDVDVCIVPVPDAEPEEIDALRQWYEARTGQTPPNLGAGDFLLVQLFFEWRTGEPLRSFARRFKRRIEAADPDGDLLAFTTVLLALNRLYVGYPGTAYRTTLSPRLRDMLAVLQQEHHIAAGERDDRDGVWLAHPHLSNCIYEAWFPAARHLHMRREHLRQGAAVCRTYGVTPALQTAPIWALSRGWAERVGDLRVRMPGDVLETLEALYDDAQDEFRRDFKLSHLPVWIKLQSGVAAGRLRPDPVAMGVAELTAARAEVTGLRLLCHMLLEAPTPPISADLTADARRAVMDLLGRMPEWREWPAVAGDVLTRESTAALRAMILTWCRSHPEHAACPRLLKQLLRAPFVDTDTLQQVSEFVAVAPDNFTWGDVAIELLETDGNLSDAVQRWVNRHSSSDQIVFVLGRLLRSAPSPELPGFRSSRAHGDDSAAGTPAFPGFPGC